MNGFSFHSVVVLLVGAASAPTLAADVTESELMQAATELGRQYDTNYNDKDPAAVAALYTSDGVLASPSGPIVRGREALRAYYAQRFAPAPVATPSKSSKSMFRGMAAMALPTSRHRAAREWRSPRGGWPYRRGLSTRPRRMATAPR